MVPAQPHNIHPSTRLMQREPINLLNLLRRGTISGIQNSTLYCKIYTVIQFFRRVHIWSLAQGLYKTLDPLFLYQKNPRYQALKNRGTFDCTCRSGVILNSCISATNQDFEKQKKMFLVQGLRNLSQKFQTSAMIIKYRSGQAHNLCF